MKGIVLAGGTGSRMYPIAQAANKQMLPIYDKPMIYYPISVLMLSGIKEILIITTSQDLPAFNNLLGDGSRIGVRFTMQSNPNQKDLPRLSLLGKNL